MLDNLKITFRNLRRNRLYSFINVGGLAVGMAAVGFIALWLYGALTFDAFHTHAKETYLITYTIKHFEDGVEWTFDQASFGLVSVLEQNPDIQNMAIFTNPAGFESVRVHDQTYSLRSRAFVNPDWFKMFDYNVLDGSVKEFGADPFQAVLTLSEAHRLFGVEQAVGEIIIIEKQPFTVCAVVKDPPLNSSFTHQVLLPVEAQRITLEWAQHKYDGNYFTASYFVRLSKKADKGNIIRSIEKFFKEENRQATPYLLPLKKMHFEDRTTHPTFDRGDSKPVYLLSILALLLVVVACLNYINLATARNHIRAKEMDIKKILGAKPWNLFGQMMYEAWWANFLAMLCALLLVMALVPYVETRFQVSLSYFRSPVLWMVFVVVLCLTTLLSGVYPAVMLGLLKPLTAIRGGTVLGAKSGTVRKVLVVFQFVVSAGLILAIMVLSLQTNYIRNDDPGYNRYGVASFIIPFRINPNMQQNIKEELGAYPSIQSVSLSSTGSIARVTSGINGGANWDGYDDSDHRYRDFKIKISSMNVDADFLQTLGLKMVEGRWFNRDYSTDRNNVVINETAAKELNIAAPYVGQRFSVWGRQGEIIGIVKDFHFNSRHYKIGPMVLSNTGENFWVVFKSQPGKMSEAVAAAREVWQRFFPEAPFEVRDTEDVYNNLYQDDAKQAQMVSMFGLLSIFISCLGLFGLVTFTAETRTKEIGIRKVLGAKVRQMVYMLSKEFLVLVGIAMLVAFPMAYYWLHRMLQDYAYRISITWWMFALAAAITVLLTLLTVGRQAIRAATANPVESIKSE